MQASRFPILFLIAASATAAEPPRLLEYRQPAQKWESEALPIGNGRMGAMLFGGVGLERIQFNEQSLWSGDNNWDGAYECGDHGFGAYRNFGEFVIDFNNIDNVKSYERSLDINTGINTTSFESNGIKMHREAFASHPDQ